MLTDCIRVQRSSRRPEDPEDIFSASLSTIFVDDTQNCHGDTDALVIYDGGSRIGNLKLTLPDPDDESQRKLFAHYLWNASIWIAQALAGQDAHCNIDVTGQTVLELGAGLGLASIVSCLLGAEETVASDYPAESVLDNVRRNVAGNVRNDLKSKITVAGHQWGILDDTLSQSHRQKFTRIIAADCLWMPHEHKNLARSIASFLSPVDKGSRAYIAAGFHTGRAKMAGFFDIVQEVGLEIEEIWEEDIFGCRRAWSKERDGGKEDVTGRKRWLAIAVLKLK